MKELPRRFVLGAVLAASMLCASAAGADERRGGREARHERYHTDHWVYDDRFHHDHYYPRVGYAVTVLPPGHIALTFRGAPYFFHGGVWYRHSGARFVVVAPPIGIVVPVLPPSYATVVVAGRPYYYANDVYYIEASGGYAVTSAPAGAEETAAQPMVQPPAPTASASSQPAPSATWYYCESSKTYYPYVKQCKEGWRAVPATPPQ